MKNIRIENLNVSYGNLLVLNNFKAEIERGAFNIILGSSGSGKTTFLKVVMGLEKYTGNIYNLDKMSLSAIFQENRLLEEYSIIDNINFVQKKDLSIEIIENEMKKIGLECSGNKIIKELSGGMKRRVAILRGLLFEADLYILDEPFKELDKDNYNLVISFVKDRLNGKTVLISTHNEEEIDYFNASTIRI